MATASTQPALPTGAVKWTVLGTAWLSAFVFSVNARSTILISNDIIQELALDRYRAQWITGPEGIAGLTTLFSSMYLVQVFGARRIFLLGTLCLTVGCLGVALARTPWPDGVAGVVRNCAGFYVIPALAIVQRLLPRRKALVYCSFLTLVYGGQAVAEPVGALVAFNPSWRLLFVILGLCGLWFSLCALFLFPDDRPDHKPEHPFDFAGALLFMIWLALAFFLLYRGNYLGWHVSTRIRLALVALGVVTVLFIGRELTAAEPFINLTGFTYRTVTLTMLTAAFWCAVLYGLVVQFPDYLILRGYEHWKAGWVTLPMTLVLMLSMFAGAFLTQRRQHVWVLRLGLAGMTGMGLLLAGVDLYTPWQWMMTVTSVWAVFAGMCLAPIGQLVFEGQHAREAAATSAMKFFMRSFGATLGILVAGILLERAAAARLEYIRVSVQHGQGALEVTEPAIQDYMVRHGSAPPTAAAQAGALIDSVVNLQAEMDGYRTVLRFCAYLSALGLAVSCFLGGRKEVSVFDEAA